jgi:hypothetical protein
VCAEVLPMTRTLLAVFALALSLAACGGPSGGPTADTASSAAPAMETRWLRGLWASDIQKALSQQHLTCQGPKKEGQTNAWSCDWGTVLVQHKVLFYGSAPGKIEYLKATVSQSDQPKDSRVLPLFTALAGLHFNGAEPAKAREWVEKTTANGGETVFGPAKFKLSGDVTRRSLEIKASGSEW